MATAPRLPGTADYLRLAMEASPKNTYKPVQNNLIINPLHFDAATMASARNIWRNQQTCLHQSTDTAAGHEKKCHCKPNPENRPSSEAAGRIIPEAVQDFLHLFANRLLRKGKYNRENEQELS